MNVQVRFFSVARDLVGADERTVTLPEGSKASSVVEVLGEEFPPLLDWRRSIRIAVNMEYVQNERILREGDEVALIPPVSGG